MSVTAVHCYKLVKKNNLHVGSQPLSYCNPISVCGEWGTRTWKAFLLFLPCCCYPCFAVLLPEDQSPTDCKSCICCSQRPWLIRGGTFLKAWHAAALSQYSSERISIFRHIDEIVSTMIHNAHLECFPELLGCWWPSKTRWYWHWH